jgi:hypothetical protein
MGGITIRSIFAPFLLTHLLNPSCAPLIPPTIVPSQKMIALRDEVTGKPVFESISISLVCEACLKTDSPQNCTHRVRAAPTQHTWTRD